MWITQLYLRMCVCDSVYHNGSDVLIAPHASHLPFLLPCTTDGKLTCILSPLLTIGENKAYTQRFLTHNWLLLNFIAVWLIYGCSVQFSSVTQSRPTLCDPMNRSTSGLPVHHHLLEFTQTHIHRVGDAIQPSHPLLSPSPLAFNPSQQQSLFQWVNILHEVAKVLEFQL